MQLNLKDRAAIKAENDGIDPTANHSDDELSGLSRIRTGDLLRVRQTS
jgi:hypothetical protein